MPGLLARVALALLVACPPAFAEPSEPLLAGLGTSPAERQAVTRALTSWRARVAAGKGSKEALACVDRGGSAGPFLPCVAPARAASDRIGAGLAGTLAACEAFGRQEPEGASGLLEAGIQDLEWVVTQDDGLWGFLYSTSGVLLAARGRHPAAVAPVEEALGVIPTA